ncbi:MAG: DUF305 domain-containing protein [Acidimicrobiia bacterium]
MTETDADADLAGPAATGSGPGAGPDAAGDDEPAIPAGGLSWGRVVAVVLVAAWFGGAVGWVLGNRSDDPGPGSVDAGFYLDMIAHHEQAVEMALVELARGDNAVVRSFAQEVVIFQQYEIGRMDEALESWGLSRADRAEQAMGWMGMPVAHDAMPGLATPEQMAELRQAEGSDADARFLELMAEHHRGGVHMATYAADHAAEASVRDLAALMARNQAVEINEYRQTAERYDLDADIEPYPVTR